MMFPSSTGEVANGDLPAKCRKIFPSFVVKAREVDAIDVVVSRKFSLMISVFDIFNIDLCVFPFCSCKLNERYHFLGEEGYYRNNLAITSV